MTATEELSQILHDLVVKETEEVFDQISADQKFMASLDWDFEEPWKIRAPSGDGASKEP